MKKVRRIVAIIIAAISLSPNSVVFADTNNNTVEVQIINSDVTGSTNVEHELISTTTPPAVVVSTSTSTTPSSVSVGIVDIESEYSKALKSLSTFQASNSTTDSDILEVVTNNIDSRVKVKVSQEFIMTNSTPLCVGNITGTLIISNTDASRSLKVNLTIAKTEQIKDTVVTNLIASFTKLNSNNELEFGINTVSVKGYNTEMQEVPLNFSKIEYTWYANGEVVGHEKNLEITPFLSRKNITCNINY